MTTAEVPNEISLTARFDGIDAYCRSAIELLSDAFDSQRGIMEQVARHWSELIVSDHMIFSFGSGHSRFIAGELHFRAGGLVPVMSIDDPGRGVAERLEGYGQLLVDRYEISAGDCTVVISNSGINPLPIELAEAARARGSSVVAVTSSGVSSGLPARHSSGRKLYEVADFVLDTGVPAGDAVVPLDGYAWSVAPVSTLISVGLLNSIIAQVARNLVAAGVAPPVLASVNAQDGDDHNHRVVERYWRRLASFPLRPQGSSPQSASL